MPEDRARHRHGWWRRGRHSIGWRIVALFLALALAMSAIFLGGMQRALSGGWQEFVRPLLSDYVDRLVADIGSPPDVARAQALAQRLPITVRIDGPQVRWASDPRAEEVASSRWRRWRDWSGRGAGDRRDDLHDDGGWLLTRATADGHRITFGLGLTDWHEKPRFVGGATLVALLLLTALAYAYVRHLLRPLRDIRAGAERFGTGDFSTPIAVRRHDELGALASQVNTMAGSLRGMLESQRELLLAISHELRSPLTRARLNAELLPDDEAQRGTREALLRDLAEMRDLIADLLESERLASGHAALQREPSDLSALVHEVIEAQFGDEGLRLALSETLPVLSLDRLRLRLLVRNLIDNALRHGGTGTERPRVATQAVADGVQLVVRDFGPGVPEDRLAQLGQPFVRIDAARARATGGVGLGLHLCRRIVQAHGGTFELRNAAPGLEVTVTFRRDVDRSAD